jgi:hypothetical protein
MDIKFLEGKNFKMKNLPSPQRTYIEFGARNPIKIIPNMDYYYTNVMINLIYIFI